MNRLFYLLALLLVVSCSDKGEFVSNTTAEKVAVVSSSDIVFDNSDDNLSSTRSSLTWVTDGSTNRVEFAWSSGDHILVCSGGDRNNNMDYELTEGEGSNNARFRGEGFSLTDGAAYYALSPHVDISNSSKRNIMLSYEGQCQFENNNCSHLGAYDYQVAAAYASGDFVKFAFKHLGTVIRVRFKGLHGKTFKKFQIKTAEPYDFKYERYLDITDDDCSLDDYRPKLTYTEHDPEAENNTYTLMLSDDTHPGITVENVDGTLLVLYMMVPATTELVGKQLYGVVTDTKGNDYYIPMEGKEFLPGAGVSYGKVAATSGTLNISLSVWKDWQYGNTQTRAGDPGQNDELDEPTHIYVLTCSDNKLVDTKILAKGETEWAGWRDNGDRWNYKGNITANLGTPSPSDKITVYAIAANQDLSSVVGSYTIGTTTPEDLENLTYSSTDQSLLKNLYSYKYQIRHDDPRVINAKIYHTCAKLDVQWNSASALSTSQYVSVNGVPTTGLSLFNPVDCGGTGSQAYSEAITTGNKYNGRAVFYVPQLSPPTYNISVGAPSEPATEDNVTFTAPTTNKWTSWFKANIKK